jgi:hypothetical protein
MRDLYLKIEESKDDEPFRIVAEGTPLESGAAWLPGELLDAFNRHLNEFELTSGTWPYQIGTTKYKIHFSPTARAPKH